MKKDHETARTKHDIYSVVSILILLGSLLVITMISFLSEFGHHPDEYDVKECLNWGITHWIWPDMRTVGIGLGDTYSWYGYTKVCNYTPYFLIAGKIAWPFKLFMDVLPWYRMPNLLLAILLMFILIKRLKDKPYLMLGFGVCVQAWYIFSYVTADAQDFLLTFISIMLLCDKESLLWKTIDSEDEKRSKIVLQCILLGLLYGLILLGKYYYYANVMLAFIVLVSYMIKQTSPEVRKKLLLRYILIAGTCAAVWLGRCLIDVHYYGFDRNSAKIEMAEKYASPDKKPSTPVEEQDVTWKMASKGYTIADFFKINDTWFARTFRSFASCRITVTGDNFYYVIIALLYIFVYTFIGIYLCREGNAFLFIFGTLLNISGVVASLGFSYISDCQPQGRYLLPIVLTTCYLGSLSRSLWNNKVFRYAVLLTGVMSVAYFGLKDSRELIDLTYAKNLILG
ncbi:MAG: hypothetical protein K6A38_05655 [Lachnospiraceae bacterium]|nr:hypothetical protein [Lachnospiraceae bacterium]